MTELESRILEWRAFVAGSAALDGRDVEELEAHLRDQVADLDEAGLSEDEAFLVAVKRMGAVDDLSRQFALEHSGRLWQQLVVSGGDERTGTVRGLVEALLFAVGAAVVVQVAFRLADFETGNPLWVVRNAGLFVLPFLAGLFARRRGLSLRDCLVTMAPFAGAAVIANVYPYVNDSATELLVAAHLPVALWFAVALAYIGGMSSSGPQAGLSAGLQSHERRMDFVRFTGEWFLYYVLIALGGGVLMGLTGLVLEPTGVDAEQVIEWVLPSGAAGAVLVAAWLVESKQRVIENMAPVLTMIFTPLFAVMLAVAVVAYAVTGVGGAFDRELVGVFDALMVVVLGLVLYGLSARDPLQGPGWMDRIQLVAVESALVLDVMVLAVMVTRIGELGFTPNRTAAVGLNLVLLVNLAGTAWRSVGFLAGRSTFHRLERWQTSYLLVFATWAAIVVVALPPLFAFA